ncbi:MAG: dTDP-glucose 4,6-dehydratase [Spirochaetaceae bacterium]|nr:dTDP-glucose 4,6-dehydratase [Spirochaetaceae bacterium]
MTKQPRTLSNVLVTGGAGFIGSNFIRFLFSDEEFTGKVFNLDSLTYAGNLENLADVQEEHGGTRYHFIEADIRDFERMDAIFSELEIDTVVHFAAESHVDRSIVGPRAFIETNIIGTANLLEAARAHWAGRDDVLFHHVSTDEVFGSLGETGRFTENTSYDPKSPYSASKASSDHLVRAWGHTYGLPFTISNCSNNYGPYQFPEKMIPVMIMKMVDRKPLPVYGDGSNVRDWLYVDDHSSAIIRIMRSGRNSETYVVGGENEWQNLKLVRSLCTIVAEETKSNADQLLDLITFVKDRPGHDLRYAIDCTKTKSELGWTQRHTFDEGLHRTVRWYLDNPTWVEHVRSGEYRNWMERNYDRR